MFDKYILGVGGVSAWPMMDTLYANWPAQNSTR